ncbi:type III-B CRISPR module RAMP protein Cmr6 [Thiohalocapsa sp. ML1]|uniref:type III-B CRISPR module RAMP protein Cmr6 n=1 Tax=Thiohalocapsa sp. ML1 TaxID=1431688 RepID=UPI0007322CF0|nr:type III-B CRISPR module RAMP protein Cmr6 [Thiohalocapsa sp. ML1]
MTALIRNDLRNAYTRARDAHAGLLIQRGYQDYDNETEAGRVRKTGHIQRICAVPPSTFYVNAYQRWSDLVRREGLRFRVIELTLESRLFIGLTAGGMLETGCAIHHSYGMPYLMGSSIKGAVAAHVRASPFGKVHAEICNDLFGAEPSTAHPVGLAGVYTFHDAWWVPGSAASPMVQEVVTTHHLDYYGKEGEVPASDLDSPVPNAQIAVQGAFLFAIEGPPAWMHLAEAMLRSTLVEAGIGAKRRAGYGYFVGAAGGDDAGCGRCPWVDETIIALVQANRSKEDEVLRGKGLAERWQAIDDPDLKARALADIRARWQARDWWEDPSGKSARLAKAIYAPPD